MAGPETRKKPPKKALGRGLAALLGEDDLPPAGPVPPPEAKPGERVVQVPIERLEPNPFQPRRVYDPEALAALAASIAEHGVIQPVVVRPVEGGYQLIAGERRLRAAMAVGLTTLPAVVRPASDQQALLLALLENLQREDLNPLEEARAYHRLVGEFSLSQEEIAKGVGKNRTTVTNSLRLLKLPAEVQDDLLAGRLTAGHARALLSLEDNPPRLRQARDLILAKGLSVRATEKLVKELGRPPRPAPPPLRRDQIYFQSLAEELSRKLGAKVEIRRKGRRGAITLAFASDEELERLLAILG